MIAAENNAVVIGRARTYTSALAEQIRAVTGAPEPRFDVWYQCSPGGGSGGTAGVTAEQADHYLKGLARERSVARYGILTITVTPRIGPLNISA